MFLHSRDLIQLKEPDQVSLITSPCIFFELPASRSRRKAAHQPMHAGPRKCRSKLNRAKNLTACRNFTAHAGGIRPQKTKASEQYSEASAYCLRGSATKKRIDPVLQKQPRYGPWVPKPRCYN